MQKDPVQKKAHLFQSLGIRILLISLILLVLPLLSHNLFMYWSDYQEKKDNLFLSLKIVGENKAYDVQQYIQSEENFLKWIAKEEISKDLLAKAQSEEALSTLSYISLENNNYLFSTNTLPIDSLKVALNKKQAFLYESNSEKILIISAPVIKDSILLGYLISETPISALKTALFKPFSFPYPLNIHFFSNDNDPYPENSGEEPFSVFWENKDYFAKRVPFKDTNFSLLFFVLESDVYELSINKVLYNVLQLLIFFFLIGGIFVYFLTKRMYRPIKHLLKIMEKIASHDLIARYKPDRMGFEINVLGIHFNNMIDSLIQYQEEVERIHIKKEALRKELEIGRDIQQSLFPKQIPSIQNLNIASYCEQAKEVGGDFYDLFVTEDRLIFCVADVAGKGISACLYSLGIRSLIRSAFAQEEELTKALQTVNSLFHEDVGDIGVFTTLWLGSLNLTTNILTYSSLGHHPALLKRDGKLIELTSQSNALGPFKKVFIETKTITLQKNDLLFLYTDGVIDRQNTQEEFYGYENIKSFLLKENTENPDKVIKTFIQELNSFAKGEPLYDDLTLVSISQK